MKKTITLILLALLTLSSSFSQDYDTGIGAKIGMAPGISAKHFITTNGAVEGILTVRWGGANLSGLWERHLPVFDTEGFYFYYGGGFHVGVWDSGLAMDQAATELRLNLGLDAIVGLEYAFDDVPFLLGLDWKPNANFFQDTRMIIDEISIVLRYLFR